VSDSSAFEIESEVQESLSLNRWSVSEVTEPLLGSNSIWNQFDDTGTEPTGRSWSSPHVGMDRSVHLLETHQLLAQQ